jgi:PAS domain S-box-containing protein
MTKSFIEHYEYAIKGTPCEKALEEKSYLHIPENVVDLFPGDPDLPKIGAVSYIGFPLLDPAKNILGNIAVVDTRPMPDSFRNLAVFRIFAARATAELLRLRAEAELRGREEKLRGVFNGAMDAIVELDREFRITMLNPSAQRLFGTMFDKVLSTALKPFLVREDYDRLAGIIRKLESQPKTERNIWIPEGLTAVTAHGEKIRTEATLSHYEMNGAPFYALILRDVNKRYEAEKLIDSFDGIAPGRRHRLAGFSRHSARCAPGGTRKSECS